MKSGSQFLAGILVVAILLYSPQTRAADFTIGPGDYYEYFEVSQAWFGFPNPVVDMNGGVVGIWDDPDSGMHVCDEGLLNMCDGTIEYLRTYNSATANISGGLVGPVEVGPPEALAVLAYDSSTISTYDGAFLFTAGLGLLWLYDSSTLNVFGGDVVMAVLCLHSSTVNVYGGECDWGIYPDDSSLVNVYGGYIDAFEVASPPPTATINVHGYGFVYEAEARWVDDHWLSKLTGFGPDGTPITYWGMPDPCTHSNVHLIPDFVLERHVDFRDFAVLARAWKSEPGDDNWNEYCDVSDPNDGIIDERDLAVVCNYWVQ